MKTKLLVTAILLFLATSMIATNPKVVRNKIYTESGTMEEAVLYPKSNTAPTLKSTKRYDLAGTLQEEIKFQWNKYTNDWLPVYKKGFSENRKTKKLVIAYTKWHVNNNDWSKDTQIITYDYKDDGMLSIVTEQDLKLK